MDLEFCSRWVEYSRAKDTMFTHTGTKQSPGMSSKAMTKSVRLNVISSFLSLHDYEDLSPEQIELPPR